MAACFAAKGHRVVGVDVNSNFVRAINESRAPVFEPGLQEMLARSGGRLRATTDIEEAAAQGPCPSPTARALQRDEERAAQVRTSDDVLQLYGFADAEEREHGPFDPS